MIKLTKYTTTQISTTLGVVTFIALALQAGSNLSLIKLVFFAVGSYILSLEIAAILFAMRLPAKFYKKYQVEPFYTVNIAILVFFMLDTIRKGDIMALPFGLPLLTALLVGIQFAYYRWFGTVPSARLKVKARRRK